MLGRFSCRIKPLSQNLSNKNANVPSLPSPVKSASPSSATNRLNRVSRSVFCIIPLLNRWRNSSSPNVNTETALLSIGLVLFLLQLSFNEGYVLMRIQIFLMSFHKSCLMVFAFLFRLPVELSSMIPLHNAIASSRLVSSLSIESQSWGLVPQGLFFSLPIFPSCVSTTVTHSLCNDASVWNHWLA